MQMPIIRYKLFIGAILAAVVWLVPNWADMLEEPADPVQNKCPYGSPGDPIKKPRPYYAGAVVDIRLTNSGEFVRRCEFTDALYELNWDQPPHSGEFRPPVKADAKSLPKLVVLYVHGWKHDASPNDPDHQKFSKFIATLQAANVAKQVLGIYVGWNAAPKLPPFNLPGPDNLSFWSKERIADRIAQSGVLTKIVAAIGAMRKDNATGSDQFIAMGHSFGARILFSAIEQTLIYEIEKSHPGFPGGKYKVTVGPTNAAILLNPAFEASRYTSIDDVFRNEEQFDQSQKPLLLTVSSRGDLATRLAFPAGQWLNFFRSPRERTTLGNYTCYQTHALEVDQGSCGSAPDLSKEFKASSLCLSRTARQCGSAVAQNRNPFIVATTSAEIISGHNDIWNERFAGWLLAYVDELQKQKSSAEPQ